MPGTVHLLFGAALGALIPDISLMVVLAFFSHYLLDFMPHLDPDTFADGIRPYTWWQRATLAADTTLVVSLILALWWLRGEPFPYLLGAIIALLPDLMSPLESYQTFLPLKKIHVMFHWNKDRARWWSWYIPALVAPVVISTVALLVIWSQIYI